MIIGTISFPGKKNLKGLSNNIFPFLGIYATIKSTTTEISSWTFVSSNIIMLTQHQLNSH